MACNHTVCFEPWNLLLDVVPDCTSKSCIKVLRLFISDSGAPQVIISDNENYFTCEHPQNFVNSLKIKWKFNIEDAP